MAVDVKQDLRAESTFRRNISAHGTFNMLFDLILFVILIGIPVWLVATAWSRYAGIGQHRRSGLLGVRLGLTFISGATGIWLAVFALMVLQDRIVQVQILARRLSPGSVGLANLGLCVIAIFFTQLASGSDHDVTAIKRRVLASGSFLALISLFLLANPH